MSGHHNTQVPANVLIECTCTHSVPNIHVHQRNWKFTLICVYFYALLTYKSHIIDFDVYALDTIPGISTILNFIPNLQSVCKYWPASQVFVRIDTHQSNSKVVSVGTEKKINLCSLRVYIKELVISRRFIQFQFSQATGAVSTHQLQLNFI